jgi:hypothetical protein
MGTLKVLHYDILSDTIIIITPYTINDYQHNIMQDSFNNTIIDFKDNFRLVMHACSVLNTYREHPLFMMYSHPVFAIDAWI